MMLFRLSLPCVYRVGKSLPGLAAYKLKMDKRQEPLPEGLLGWLYCFGCEG